MVHTYPGAAEGRGEGRSQAEPSRADQSASVMTPEPLGGGAPHDVMNAAASWTLGVDDDLAAAVDELIAGGVVSNRSAAVRLGLEQLVALYRRIQIGALIVESYRPVSQNDVEMNDGRS